VYLADRAARAAVRSNKLFFKINLNGTDFKIRYLGAFRPLRFNEQFEGFTRSKFSRVFLSAFSHII